MSRIGNKAVELPNGVTVTVSEDNHVTVKGPKGALEAGFSKKMTIVVNGSVVTVSRPNDLKENKALHGTTRALINNMVKGVSEGFQKGIEIKGVGYRAQLKGNVLVVSAGYSHPVELPIPAGLTIESVTPTELIVKGMDKELVGKFAADIRSVREPEPYLGKGIRYKGENVRRKERKTAKK